MLIVFSLCYYDIKKRQQRQTNGMNKIFRQKEEVWPSPMTEAPTPTEMSKGQSDNTNNTTKKFD